MPTDSSPRVLVVGGGLAGLASAVELASLGLRVTLIERNQHLGGKMNILRESGFSFDMGPTILTLPQVLRGIIRRSGRRVEDYINLINLSPQWRCHYEDGTVIDLTADAQAMADALDRQFPQTRPGRGYMQFIEFSRRMMRLSEKVFFYRDVGGVLDMIKDPPKDKGVMRDALAMRMHSTVAATVHAAIPQSHVRQICEHFLQYVGSSPFMAPAILSLIAAAQTDHGCWYSMAPDGQSGGTRCVAQSLERIAREQGVEIITGVGVRRILVSADKATGVELDDGRTLSASAVISNCDVQRTHRDLIGTSEARAQQRTIARDYTPACSGVVLYLGLARRYEHLAHHNFLFSHDSHEEFGDIYRAGRPARNPTLYIAAPSRSDPTQAPPGGEALYVLVHVPYTREGQKWEGPGGMLEAYKPVIMSKLRRFGMEDIDRHIVVDRFLSPDGIERLYNAEGGAIYGLASHGRLKGGFKPRNRSRLYQGLYFSGGSANPGPGVPMVLMSGVTAARAAAADLGFARAAEPLPLGRGVENPLVTSP
ncbi:MAG: phytoene desaturase [Phycisphaeraceae bacterium]|nr:phytoene desaturase [Phycisphaeraceae bacterium]